MDYWGGGGGGGGMGKGYVFLRLRYSTHKINCCNFFAEKL